MKRKLIVDCLACRAVVHGLVLRSLTPFHCRMNFTSATSCVRFIHCFHSISSTHLLSLLVELFGWACLSFAEHWLAHQPITAKAKQPPTQLNLHLFLLAARISFFSSLLCCPLAHPLAPPLKKINLFGCGLLVMGYSPAARQERSEVNE